MPNQDNTRPAPANFTPALGSYIGVRPMRYWVQEILPLTFDDSLSYMELLNKVVAKLNEVIETVNEGEGGSGGIKTLKLWVGYYEDEPFPNALYKDEEKTELFAELDGGGLYDSYEDAKEAADAFVEQFSEYDRIVIYDNFEDSLGIIGNYETDITCKAYLYKENYEVSYKLIGVGDRSWSDYRLVEWGGGIY